MSNPSVIGQYVNGVFEARRSESKSYDLSFVKEKNGNWYIDLPEWQGSHGNLQMVAGADELLDGLLTEGNRVSVQVVKAKDEIDEYETDANYVKCHRQEECPVYGATYSVAGMEDVVERMWICPVTLFVLGEYPHCLYIKKVA